MRYRRQIAAACLVALCGLAAVALAQTASAPTAETQRVGAGSPETRAVGGARPDYSGGLWQTIGALAVVVAVIFALRIVLRKLAAPAGVTAGEGPIRVLARTQVLPRQHLLLVRLGRRVLLVGSGPNGLATLSEIVDEDEAAELSGQRPSGETK